MAVSVPTSGYAVNVMPQASLPNPQLFDIYGDFGASMARGQQQGAQLIDIVEQARMAPLRREQAQIQLQDAVAAQNRRQIMEPLEVARYRQQLAQPVETFVGAGIEEVQRQADATGAVPAGADIFATETVQLYDPMSGQTRQVTRRKAPLSTLEQQAATQGLQDYRALQNETRLAQIASQAEIAAARNEVARMTAEAAQMRAQAALSNPNLRQAAATQDADGNVVLNFVDAQGNLTTIPTGQKRSSGGTTMFGDFSFSGAAPAMQGAPASGGFNPAAAARAAAQGGAPAMQGAAPVIQQAPAAPQGGARRFTVEEARTLPSGTRFLDINGVERVRQ